MATITELRAIVENLKLSKADNILIDGNHNLILKSGDQSIACVQLPEEVTWSSWD